MTGLGPQRLSIKLRGIIYHSRNGGVFECGGKGLRGNALLGQTEVHYSPCPSFS